MGVRISIDRIKYRRYASEMSEVYKALNKDNTYRSRKYGIETNFNKEYIKAYMKLLSK